MGLFEWGIHQMDRVGNTIQDIGKRLGYIPLSWAEVVKNDRSRDGLMWRAPDPRVPQASALSSMLAIIVTEQEQVMVLRNGVLGEQIILPPGMYDIKRLGTLRGTIDVFWFTTKEVQLQWGVGDIITPAPERVTIGASGYYSVAIVDPLQFLKVVAGNEQVYTEAKLRDYAKQAVSNAIRNQMSLVSIMDFQQAQPDIERACTEKLAPIFARWGLEFRGMTVANQVIPEEWRQIAQKRTLVRMEKEAEIEGEQANIELAKLKALKEQIEMLPDAQRLQLMGNARTDVMRNQLASGIDPLELQRIEAIKILAEHPAEGALMDNRPQILNQLLPQPPITPQINPTIVTGMPFLTPPQTPNVVVSSAPAPAPAPAPAGLTGREKIQADLDKLDERFINGEISEQTYLTLQEKLQKKLDQLP